MHEPEHPSSLIVWLAFCWLAVIGGVVWWFFLR